MAGTGTGGASATGPASPPSTTKAALSRLIHVRIVSPGREPVGPLPGADRRATALVVVRSVLRGVRGVAADRGLAGRRRGRGCRRGGGGRRLHGLDAVPAVLTTMSVGHQGTSVCVGAVLG